MAFREEIRRKKRRLRLYLLAALALAAVAGRVAGEALLFTVEPYEYYGMERPSGPRWAYYPNHVAGALMLLVWVQYVRMRARGDFVVLGLVGARPFHERRLRNAADEMAIAAGIRIPRLFIVEDPSMNAFACGAGDRCAIVVTRGLVERLDRDELQGVLAHETAHIRNGDTMLMTALFGMSRVFGMTAAFALGPLVALWQAARTPGGDDAPPPPPPPPREWKPRWWVVLLVCVGAPVAGALALALSLAVSIGVMAAFALVVRYLPWIAVALAAWELWKLMGEPKKRSKPRRLGALLLLAPAGLMAGPAILLVGCVFPFFFWMLRLAVSRNREFAADARAVELTRHPAGLRSALEKLLADTARGKALPRSMSPLAIASVGAARRWNTAGWPPVARTILVFFSTHPPLRERIARLEGMGAGEGAEREPAFAGTS